MTKKIVKNKYEILDEKQARLTVTKRNGKVFRFRIDTPDVPIFKNHSWFMKKDIYLNTRINGKDVTPGEILFHPKEKGHCFDHIDRDSFNYSRENLRYVTLRENILNKWRPRTDAGDVYGIFKYRDGWRTRKADGTFPLRYNWMTLAEYRVEFLRECGNQNKLEAIQKLDFNDVEEFDFMVDLCSKIA